MMGIRRPGFTLVEVMVVTVLAAITMAAVYETLIVQERTFRTGAALIQDQESLRTALGILEAELREVGTIGGPAVGGSDIVVAGPDSVVFRAQRKIGFVCELSRSERWLLTYSLSDPFAAGDELLVFVDGDTLQYHDDRWAVASVSAATGTSDAACAARWPDVPLQKVRIAGLDLAGVREGSPVRSYDRVTYGLYDFGDRGWGLGRHAVDQAPTFLVGGLAPPGQGLVLEYFDLSGRPTSDVSAVARMRIGMQAEPLGSETRPAQLTTNLFLRNN